MLLRHDRLERLRLADNYLIGWLERSALRRASSGQFQARHYANVSSHSLADSPKYSLNSTTPPFPQSSLLIHILNVLDLIFVMSTRKRKQDEELVALPSDESEDEEEYVAAPNPR